MRARELEKAAADVRDKRRRGVCGIVSAAALAVLAWTNEDQP